MESDSELLDIFRDAVKDLLFPSEIDAPFEVKVWDKTKGTSISTTSILELTGNRLDDYIEQMKLEILFSTPTLEQDWHSEEDKQRVKRFRALQEAINRNLKEVQVYRCGKININVYIVGRASSGNIICISTGQLQT